MRIRFLTLAIFLGLGMTIAFVVAAGSVTFEEADLNSFGRVYEVNRGAGDDVLVSDSRAWEIWQVKPSGAYTIYATSAEVIDARPDANGDIWWTDAANALGRLDPQSGSADIWTLGIDLNLSGLAFDESGRVWVSQFFGTQTFRFDPQSTQLCTYTFGSPSDYIVIQAGNAWTSNWFEDRIYRLDPAGNQVTWWPIPGDNPTPKGMAFDKAGDLWWADTGLEALARLDPATGALTTYSLPIGTRPQMVDAVGDLLWYTERVSGTVGSLDPSSASGVTATLVPGAASLAADCNDLGPGTPGSLAVQTGQMSWSTNEVSPTVDGGGWTIYLLPDGSLPYGIAGNTGYIWAADQGRQKLIRLPLMPSGRLSLNVSPDITEAYHGQTISYTYAVSYTSGDDSPALNVSLIDDQCAPITFDSGDNGDGELDTDETWIYLCQLTVPGHTDGEETTIINTAVVSATDALGDPAVSAQDSASVDIVHPEGALTISKDGPDEADHGQTVNFTYTVTYQSADGSPADIVAVSDDKCSPVTGPDAAGDANENGYLDVDESWLYGCSLLIPAHSVDEENPLVNIGTVSGRDLDGDTVTGDDDQHQTSINHPVRALSVTKSGPATVSHGQQITYLYTVTYSSTTGVPVENVVISDDNCSPVTGPDPAGDANGNTYLDVDESWRYTCQFTVPDHSEGETATITNTVTVSGQDLDGHPATPGQDQHAAEIVHETDDWYIYLPIVLAQ